MKAWPILQLILLIMLLAGPSEEFFFEYSKKALQQFLESLKTRKLPPKSNIQHYHMHYYPLPYAMLWPKVPVKRDLEKFNDSTYIKLTPTRLVDDLSERLFFSDTTSFGWPDYKYLPQPSTIMSDLLQLFDTDSSTSDDTQDTIDRNGQGLLLQVPNQYMFYLLRRWQQRQLAKAMT